MISRLIISPAKTKLKTSEGLDVAARYFLYKLYDATEGTNAGPSWHSVRAFGEEAATVSRAVDRGWVAVRDEGNKGRAKQRWAALTQEGRAVARKGLR